MKPSPAVGSQPDDVAGDLETEGNVEVFGNVELGPVFVIPACVLRDDNLDGKPAEEGVVTNKGSDFAAADGEADGGED